MIGERIINNILGNKPKVDCKSKNKEKTPQDVYREMVQKGYITLEEANRTLIASGEKPL